MPTAIPSRTCSQNGASRPRTTLPGAYESQTRGFAVGGRLAIRSKSDVIQPVSLKAPNFKAGCGGLDIFGGSFSWINAEQFVSNLRPSDRTR